MVGSDGTRITGCECLIEDSWDEEHPEWAYKGANPKCLICDGQGYTIERKELGEELFINWQRLWDEGVPPIEWLFQPILQANRYTLIYAEPGHGKSLLALWMSAMVSVNENVVVYIDNDMGIQDLHERMVETWAIKPDMIQNNLKYAQHTMARVDEHSEDVVDMVKRLGARLFVLDTFRASTSLEENDSGAITNLEKNLIVPLLQYGVAVLILDHSGKDETKGARGSSAKMAQVHIGWHLEEVIHSVSGEKYMELTRTKMRMASGVPEKVWIHRTETGLVVSNDRLEEDLETKILRFLDELGAPKMSRDKTREWMIDHGWKGALGSGPLGKAIKER